MNRIYLLHQLFAAHRYPIPRARLESELACSRATLTRILAEMRDLLGAPIEYDSAHGGYHYSRDAYELPGLWFTPSELHALLAAQTLLEEAQPGLLEPRLAPLRQRIEHLLGTGPDQGELSRRVRILRQADRPLDAQVFLVVADATARRHRVRMGYRGRERDRDSERVVSPQRLVHYRDNWYLDAWCHARDEIRSFALDRVLHARVLEAPALDLDDARLDAHFKGGYGIFAGAANAIAVLHFTPQRARWVADEHWHPEQQGEWLEDGRYQLALPYADPRELLMDILKYGPDVEVVSPPELRAQAVEALQAALARYG